MTTRVVHVHLFNLNNIEKKIGVIFTWILCNRKYSYPCVSFSWNTEAHICHEHIDDSSMVVRDENHIEVVILPVQK